VAGICGLHSSSLLHVERDDLDGSVEAKSDHGKDESGHGDNVNETATTAQRTGRIAAGPTFDDRTPFASPSGCVRSAPWSTSRLVEEEHPRVIQELTEPRLTRGTRVMHAMTL
jgi:hypothetical protein